ncbi:MAG: RDD family protein [Elusimicrobium sp.]|jgi:uncharacterized RDD family membrane protein YckC|nr:RDD family protein [Elusimicrobium sp.]
MYAPFWKRAVALLIDAVIGVVVYLIIFFVASPLIIAVLAILTFLTIMGDSFFLMMLLVAGIGLVFNLIAALIPSFFDSSAWQGTPGKKIMGIKICDVNGKRISLGRAFVRNVAKNLSIQSIIGVCTALFTANKQAWHDMAADTAVIEELADVSNMQIRLTSLKKKILIIFSMIIIVSFFYNLDMLRYYISNNKPKYQTEENVLKRLPAQPVVNNNAVTTTTEKPRVENILSEPVKPAQPPVTKEEQLDNVVAVMTTLSKAMDDYLAKNGKPEKSIGYRETLDLLNLSIPGRENFYIRAGDYRIFAMLTFVSGGYWVHVDGPDGGGVLRWQADGQKQCNLSPQSCQYLTKYGFSAN